MTGKPDRTRLALKLGTIAAVVATGFLSGWSALGATGGVVFAITLGTAVTLPVFRDESTSCLSRRRRAR